MTTRMLSFPPRSDFLECGSEAEEGLVASSSEASAASCRFRRSAAVAALSCAGLAVGSVQFVRHRWSARTGGSLEGLAHLSLQEEGDAGGGDGGCASSGVDCKDAQCCSGAGLQCYKKTDEWAQCLSDCHPGEMNGKDTDGTWSCEELGPRAETTGACATKGGNCLDSQCCSMPGMQCYQKDEFWAGCLETCVPAFVNDDPTDPKSWTCKELGQRTPGEVPKQVLNDDFWKPKSDLTWPSGSAAKCSWPADDCTFSSCCKMNGFDCYEVNEYWASCMETCNETVTDKDGKPATCKQLGFSQSNQEPHPVADGEPLGTSLYCITVAKADSYEMKLVAKMEAEEVGIFKCDAHGVYHGVEVESGATCRRAAFALEISMPLENYVRIVGWRSTTRCPLAMMRSTLLLAVLSTASAGADLLSQFTGVKQFPGGSAGAISQVVMLMKELSKRIEDDGRSELASYDKYSCWCEDTLARKAKDISTAKEEIENLQALVTKLQGEIATHGAEIENLNKLIAENKESQNEAEEVRGQDNSEYEAEKTESEQCIGALEAAIRALAGAGTGAKGKFLETFQEAQLLSVASGMETVLKSPVASNTMSNQDLALVRSFFEEPGRFAGRRSGLAAIQLSNNPFGDYAPQSTRIQGVLKGLYDAFTMSLEKAHVAEAESAKNFQAFMATKKAELKTLSDTLERQELDKASKVKNMADSKLLRQDTQVELEADEKFFAATKEGCQEKAKEWAERVRMRTEELQGIDKAVEILSSSESQEIFMNSSSTLFLQIERDVDSKKLAALQSIARRYGSENLARIAAEAKARGYFDKVIGEIDEMIALLRKEDAMDIEHRDRCQNAENANKNNKEDLEGDISKAESALKVMEGEEKELGSAISDLETEIAESKKNKEELLKLRNKEESEFRDALLVDQQAVELITKAIESMKAFYKRNRIDTGYLQKKQEPEFTVDPDKAPETVWDSHGTDGKYEGRQSEHVGVTAILEMIREDIIKEIEVAKKDDASAQAEYKKQDGTLSESLRAQEETKASTEKEMADLQAKILAKEEFKKGKSEDLNGEDELAKTLEQDCAWVESHFDSRKTKRKAEMDGLVAAKNYLAGVEDGTALDASFNF